MVRAHIKSRLSAKDLILGRVLTLWQSFFALRCDDKDLFLSFYSNAKHLWHKLREEKSTALQDDTFLCAFFAGIINVPELSEITKKFLTVHSKKTEVILDLVHADFRAMHTKEFLEDGVAVKGSVKHLRRAQTVNDKALPKKKPASKGPPVVQYRRFPKNTGGLIPGDVYRQVRDWYGASAKTDDDKTDEDKAFLKAFKFEVAKPSFHKRGNPRDRKHSYNNHRNARRAERWSEERDRCKYGSQHDYSPEACCRRDYHDHSRSAPREGTRGGCGDGGEQRAARRTMLNR